MQRMMYVETKVVFGKPWLGIGMIRYWLNVEDHFTEWTLMLTNRFSIGIHFKGRACA